ncbi:hypothetical protein U9M48_036763 [Paspalum notatum var. saurae]|uniref:Uncharacterized protein n=1 Tax=Paspalum notatum var. saurae TaxID=547442 RepID=A0AAQ3XBH5_PASNO
MYWVDIVNLAVLPKESLSTSASLPCPACSVASLLNWISSIFLLRSNASFMKFCFSASNDFAAISFASANAPISILSLLTANSDMLCFCSAIKISNRSLSFSPSNKFILACIFSTFFLRSSCSFMNCAFSTSNASTTAFFPSTNAHSSIFRLLTSASNKLYLQLKPIIFTLHQILIGLFLLRSSNSFKISSFSISNAFATASFASSNAPNSILRLLTSASIKLHFCSAVKSFNRRSLFSLSTKSMLDWISSIFLLRFSDSFMISTFSASNSFAAASFASTSAPTICLRHLTSESDWLYFSCASTTSNRSLLVSYSNKSLFVCTSSNFLLRSSISFMVSAFLASNDFASASFASSNAPNSMLSLSISASKMLCFCCAIKASDRSLSFSISTKSLLAWISSTLLLRSSKSNMILSFSLSHAFTATSFASTNAPNSILISARDLSLFPSGDVGTTHEP